MILKPKNPEKLFPAELKKVISLLQAGELVAIPTETVYGLAADATNSEAIAKIFQAKGRPRHHPLILHLASAQQLSHWAIDIPPAAYKLADAFWPGPLTMVLKKKPSVSNLITGGQDTIAIRVPNNPLTLQILEALKTGLVAPSANRFGRISPTSAVDVQAEFGDDSAVKLIVDGGQCQIGIESTIVNLTSKQPTILRLGMISAAQISEVLAAKTLLIAAMDEHLPRVSGSLKSHYAPQTPTKIIASDKLISYISQHKNKKIAVLARQKKLQEFVGHWSNMSNDAKVAAQNLYQQLRYLDQLHCDMILIEAVPQTEEWAAINDRIQRAAA